MASLKTLVKNGSIALLGARRFDQLCGRLDYFRRRDDMMGFGGPLNNSFIRQDTVRALHSELAFEAIVETGTYHGDSCAFFASLGVPVHSAEVQPRFYAFAHMRLKYLKNVHVFFGDSRELLDQLAQSAEFPGERVLFYLDAHWQADLPLRDEIAFIFDRWRESIVIIDDFQVPDDPGYTFDDYGGANVLNLDYLTPLSHCGFQVFFPSAPSAEENEPRRGWVSLARDQQALRGLSNLPQLRPWQFPATGAS